MGLKKWRNLVLSRSGIYSTHPLLTIVDCVRLLLLLLLLLRVAGHDTAVEVIWVQLWLDLWQLGQAVHLYCHLAGVARAGGGSSSSSQVRVWCVGCDKLPGRAPRSDCSHGVPTAARRATTTPRCRGRLGHSPQPSFVEHGAASWERGLPLQQPCRPVLVVHVLWCSVLSLRYWYLCTSIQWWTMINCWYLQCHVGIPTHREGGGARHILHQ